jgi:hypothetical protein
MTQINYKGKGEHSVNDLELIIEQQAEELHLIKSGQSGQLVCSCGSIKVQTTGGSKCPNNRCSSAGYLESLQGV